FLCFLFVFTPHSVVFIVPLDSSSDLPPPLPVPSFSPGLVLDLEHLTLGARGEAPNEATRAHGTGRRGGTGIRGAVRRRIRRSRRGRTPNTVPCGAFTRLRARWEAT